MNKIKQYLLPKIKDNYIIIILILIGFFFRFLMTIKYDTFYGDQLPIIIGYINSISDPNTYLFPGNSMGGFLLPDLALFYSFLGLKIYSNPISICIVQYLFGCISIIFFYTIINLILNKHDNKKFLYIGLISYIFNLYDIFYTSVMWTPMFVIPFFFMLIVSLKKSLEYDKGQNWIIWHGLFGIITAFIISFHSSSLITIPAANTLVIVYTLWNQRKNKNLFIKSCIGWIVSIALFLITLRHYIYNDYKNNFQNTKSFINFLFQQKNHELFNPIEKFNNLLNFLFHQFSDFFFVGFSDYVFYLSTFIYIISFSIIFLKTNFKKPNLNPYFKLGIFYWIIFLLVLSNLNHDYVYHYEVIIYWLPIIIFIKSISMLNKNIIQEKILLYFMYIFILISILLNLKIDLNLFISKYGEKRYINTSDLISGLNNLPQGSVICALPRSRYINYASGLPLLSNYYLKKNFRFEYNCKSGNFVFFSKNEYTHFIGEKNKTSTFITKINDEDDYYLSQFVKKIEFENKALIVYKLM